MKLSEFEKEILKSIQKYYPVSWQQVVGVYEITNSFDGTIRAIENHTTFAEDLGTCAVMQTSYTKYKTDNVYTMRHRIENGIE